MTATLIEATPIPCRHPLASAIAGAIARCLAAGIGIGIAAGAASGTAMFPLFGTVYGAAYGLVVAVVPTLLWTAVVLAILLLRHRDRPVATHARRDLLWSFAVLTVLLFAIGCVVLVRVLPAHPADVVDAVLIAAAVHLAFHLPAPGPDDSSWSYVRWGTTWIAILTGVVVFAMADDVLPGRTLGATWAALIVLAPTEVVAHSLRYVATSVAGNWCRSLAA